LSRRAQMREDVLRVEAVRDFTTAATAHEIPGRQNAVERDQIEFCDC